MAKSYISFKMHIDDLNDEENTLLKGLLEIAIETVGYNASQSLDGKHEGNPYMLVGDKEGTHFVSLQKIWKDLREKAGLADLRLHDLRHLFASVGAGRLLRLMFSVLGYMKRIAAIQCIKHNVGSMKIKGGQYRYYKYTKRMSKGNKSCPSKNIPADKLEELVLNNEAQYFFKQITIGKKSNDCIFIQNNGNPWGRSHQTRPMKEACARASIEPAVSFHILRHTHESLLAMKGVPMAVIAHQLGHADTRMTEKHYAHLTPSYIADTIRQHMPTFGMEKDKKVVRIFKPKREPLR